MLRFSLLILDRQEEEPGRKLERGGEAPRQPHSQAGDAVGAVAGDMEPLARVGCQPRVPAREHAVGVAEALAQGRQRVDVLVRRRRDHGHDEDGRGDPQGSRGGDACHGVVW